MWRNSFYNSSRKVHEDSCEVHEKYMNISNKVYLPLLKEVKNRIYIQLYWVHPRAKTHTWKYYGGNMHITFCITDRQTS